MFNNLYNVSSFFQLLVYLTTHWDIVILYEIMSTLSDSEEFEEKDQDEEGP